MRQVGPHPEPQFQIISRVAQFRGVVPWLMRNRQGIGLLVHPLIDNSYDDHSRDAIWFGAPELNTMRRSQSVQQYPTTH